MVPRLHMKAGRADMARLMAEVVVRQSPWMGGRARLRRWQSRLATMVPRMHMEEGRADTLKVMVAVAVSQQGQWSPP